MRRILVFCLVIFCISCSVKKGFFKNPVLTSGADPWSLYKDGYYYYTHTTGDRIVIWKARNLAKLKRARRKTVFDPPPGTKYSEQLWAPEIHHINNSWYVYFAADDGNNNNHRLYVLENKSKDPLSGSWSFKGKIADTSDKWAIDGSVFEHNNEWYFVWSGWAGAENGQQDIYISKMKNPWTLIPGRTRISSPVYEWERHGQLDDDANPAHVTVNEGPQFLKGPQKLFIVYSASGCWTDRYGLGLLSADPGSNLLDSSSWRKHPVQVFGTDTIRKVYAPGHNSFFKSPDGKEEWILYHANDQPNLGCGKYRSPRAQKFAWNTDGTPNFGTPLKTGEWIKAPSSDKNNQREK
jgi:GH43 family beta-xylosidase